MLIRVDDMMITQSKAPGPGGAPGAFLIKNYYVNSKEGQDPSSDFLCVLRAGWTRVRRETPTD